MTAEFAFKDDIFQICRLDLRLPEGVARVASEALFWAQHPKHTFKRRLGIYKTDEELANALGRHKKTVGGNLLKVCSQSGEERAGALFEVLYGPRPGQETGRCRWLFITLEGEDVLRAAKNRQLARRERRASRCSMTGVQRSKVATKDSDRQPSSRAISYSGDCSEYNSNISHRRHEEKTRRAGTEEIREKGIERLSMLWERACVDTTTENIWLQSELNRFKREFSEIASSSAVLRLSDGELLERLKVIAGSLGEIDKDLGEGFRKYNSRGLRCSSFAMYGSQLLQLSGDWLRKREGQVNPKHLKYLSDMR